MSTNLLSLAQNAMGTDFASRASQFLGESPGTTQNALAVLLPAVIGGIAQKGATPGGATGLMSLLTNPSLDTGMLGNVAGMFSGGAGGGVGAVLKAGTSTLVPAVFGERSGALISALASSSGVKSSSASNLLAMVVPIVLMLLKKLVGERELNAGSLSSLLASQGPNLQGKLDGSLAGALGFASPGALLSGLGGAREAAADTARRAGAAIGGGAATAGSAAMTASGAAATAGATGLAKWWPWLLGIVIVGLLWWLLAPKATAPAPAPVPAATTAAPPSAPVTVAATFPAKVYFDSGSAAIGPDGSNVIAASAEAIKKDSLKTSITGYTDKTGDAATNEALAKSRALAVRDALTAAGVPEASIQMKPPLFVEAGTATTDAEGRRVEINKQ